MVKSTNNCAAFKEAYASLNAAQKKAVDSIEGPVMVVAGPGTGKTQILTLRIANILKETDVKPSNILAITFTDSGAKAMRTRLQSLIGDDAYEVAITTFHAFADSLIGKYPEAYPLIIGGRAASEVEKIQIIETILTDTAFKAVRPSGDPGFYVRPLQKSIQSLKQENVSPDKFSKAVEAEVVALREIEQFHNKGAHKGKERGEYKEAVKHLSRNQELLQVYRQYEQLLHDSGRYDFDDMILETVRALESNEDMLRDLQEQYQYVLADEHQDVNGAQNKILELLVNFHDNPNLFVVGDEKQAIYRFQGASLENFLYFEDIFPQAKIISLTENYRSGQTILDSSQTVIQTDDETLAQLRVPLTATKVKKAEVMSAVFPHTALETDWLVSAIDKDINSGISPSEIAVIVRTNQAVQDITLALRKKTIAVNPSADSDVLEHSLVVSITLLIEALLHPESPSVMTRLLHEPYMEIKPVDLGILFQNISRTTSVTSLLTTESLNELDVSKDSALYKITPLLEGLRKRSVTTAPHRLLELLLVESGLVSHVLKNDPDEGARVLRRLYDEVERMVERKEVTDLSGVLNQFSLYVAYKIPLSAPFITYGTKAVQVTTAHKAKGLEYQTVYIPQAVDKVWGSKTSRDIFKLPIVRYDTRDTDLAVEDERRLFYVAMTRAKERLIFTSAAVGVSGKDQVASRFLTAIDSADIKILDVEKFCNDFSPLDYLSGVVPHESATNIMLSVVTERGFSPTALNNYLRSPWEYFFRNVLRIPQVKTTELQFGTAVHGVLDSLVKFHEEKSVTEWQSLLPVLLQQQLQKEALSDEEYVRLHERGLNALLVYVEQLKKEASSLSRTEYHLEATLMTGVPSYPELKLNGNLDRVDFKDGKVVKVIDYKTGKPKTRNHIEGKTASSDGDYKRQLVFYALLLSLQKDQNLHATRGVLSFVEPDTHGVVKEETFEITAGEIDELKQSLCKVVEEIVSGEALTSACDPEKCRYCDLIGPWVVT